MLAKCSLLLNAVNSIFWQDSCRRLAIYSRSFFKAEYKNDRITHDGVGASICETSVCDAIDNIVRTCDAYGQTVRALSREQTLADT